MEWLFISISIIVVIALFAYFFIQTSKEFAAIKKQIKENSLIDDKENVILTNIRNEMIIINKRDKKVDIKQDDVKKIDVKHTDIKKN